MFLKSEDVCIQTVLEILNVLFSKKAVVRLAYAVKMDSIE